MYELYLSITQFYKKARKKVVTLFNWNEKPHYHEESMKTFKSDANKKDVIKFNVNLPYLGEDYMQLKEPHYLKEPVKNQTADELSNYLSGFKNESSFRIELKRIIAQAKIKFGPVNKRTLKEKQNDSVWNARQAEIDALEKALSNEYRLNDQKNKCRIYDDGDLINLCLAISDNTEMTWGGFLLGENTMVHDIRKLLKNIQEKKCPYYANRQYILKYKELNIQELSSNEGIKKRNEIIKEQREEIVELKKENTELKQTINNLHVRITEQDKTIINLRNCVIDLKAQMEQQDVLLNDIKDNMHAQNKLIQEYRSALDASHEDYKKLSGNAVDTYKMGQKDTNKFFKETLSKNITVKKQQICCPITKVPPINPVSANDGHVYEKDAILAHFRALQQNNKSIISPVTREKMTTTLKPSYFAKQVVETLKTEEAAIFQIPTSSEDESHFQEDNISSKSSLNMNGGFY
jgi:hypothetical protein